MKSFMINLIPVLVISMSLNITISSDANDENIDVPVKKFLGKISDPVKIATEAAQAFWSPDGNYIAFTKKTGKQDNPGGIYKIFLDGKSSPKRITESGKDPVWSPDGQWIAYVEEKKQNLQESVWLVDSEGTGKPIFLSEGGYPNWFPDSESILIQSRKERYLYKVKVDSKEKEKLIQSPYPYPCMSPDGTRLAFPGTGFRLFVSTLQLEDVKPISTNIQQDFLGRWSPEGDRIAFGGFINSRTYISVVNTEKFNKANILFQKQWTRPAWSPDGQYIVCDTGNVPYEVWILRSDSRATNISKLIVHLDVSEAPELADWGKNAKELIERWYQRTINLIPTKDFLAPKEIWLNISKTYHGVASTSGATITVSSDYVKKNPKDIGFVHHELVHVIQSYVQKYPTWLVEGIADYLRWAIYEGKSQHWFPFNKKKNGYRDSYQIAAGFFLWLETNRTPGIVQKLNTALRTGEYKDESFFKKEIGESIETLWNEYVESRDEDK